MTENSLSFSPLMLLNLVFRTLLPINKLPHYHGVHWSALFRHLLKPYLGEGACFSDTSIRIQTVETGVLCYKKDEIVNLGFTFPIKYASAIFRMLTDFNSLKTDNGHFQPGRTVELHELRCRISNMAWNPENYTPMAEDTIKAEVDYLQTLSEFSILLYAPLRITRPKGFKQKGHNYCDTDFFCSAGNDGASLAMNHFIQNIRFPGPDAAEINMPGDSGLKITTASLIWLDVPYGVEIAKTIGGVVGKIIVKGIPSAEIATRLVIGQYTGAGKNVSFGFGSYSISELDNIRNIAPLSRGMSLLSRAFSVESLRNALGRLPNSSPGKDSLTLEDVRRAGDIYLESISSSL
ncbi:MAG: CRISPR system precrRNA processing endoribonuclease RAMP protein Cas6, partial [Nitrospirae bacterium]|nr:CRISPR system precrRNA processing endoribonuclease RAMP protein Cas6 [Nitrospirota bacterium]